jgi:hypothetical protein
MGQPQPICEAAEFGEKIEQMNRVRPPQHMEAIHFCRGEVCNAQSSVARREGRSSHLPQIIVQ